MNPKNFTHLHMHTDASLRDGLGTVPRLLDKAKGIGFDKVAMTDHGTLANAVSFSIEAKQRGLKPILGMEGYIEFDGKIGHITLLADGKLGWNSLVNLNNIAHRSEFRQPAFTVDQLIAHSPGLVCLTGCFASPFQQLSYREALTLGRKLKHTFGHRLFAELMFVGDALAWERPIKIAQELGLKKVITNDVHFPNKTDGKLHPILTKMKSGFEYDSTELYLKSPDDLLRQATGFGLRKDDVIDMLERTSRIANLIEEIDLHKEPVLPKTDHTSSLQKVLEYSPRLKTIPKTVDYQMRINYELEIISKMGYEDYFIILKDIIDHAKDSGVKVGHGRGSGAGSLILYLLGITDVDPIKYGLRFERFLNPERRGMPDVDVDIESEKRDIVLDYASEKYQASPIATYSRYSHKSLVRDLGKMFSLPMEEIEAAADEGNLGKTFTDICIREPQFAEAYEAFLGQIRHKGKHAGGIIITDTNVPIERVGDTYAAAWTEGKANELSYAGIVKFDLLGLSALSALRRLEEKTGLKPQSPEEAPEVFQIFQTGDLSGIFQFAGSDGIRKLSMELKPTKFEDLIAINALYRPGAIDAGSTAAYPKWKESPRVVPPFIKPILEPTYGAIVYQEQVMDIFSLVVGGSYGEADLARRVITKSKPDDPLWVKKFEKLKSDFLDGTKRHGLTEKEGENLWNELATHVRYSFNKAHSTAYAMIAWECAWWKYNEPAAFFSEMLNVDRKEEQAYIIDAVKMGIHVSPPDINASTVEFESIRKTIYLPLTSIKYLGDNAASGMIMEREKNGLFKSLKDFMSRVPKSVARSRAREGLLEMGAFDDIIQPDENPWEVLELKAKPPELDHQKRSLKYLGFVMPSKKLLAKFEELEEEGWTCGVISSTDSRSSEYGPYMVYRLRPHGAFWSRDVMDLEKGQILAVKLGGRGKAKEIKIL